MEKKYIEISREWYNNEATKMPIKKYRLFMYLLLGAHSKDENDRRIWRVETSISLLMAELSVKPVDVLFLLFELVESKEISIIPGHDKNFYIEVLNYEKYVRV